MNETSSAPSGLEQLRAQMSSGKRAPIGETLDFSLVEAEAGKAVFEATPGPSAYNPFGAVHGGYIATLLDSACGCAVHTQLPADKGHTTLELKVSFLRGLTDKTGKVRAEGRVISLGRRVGFSEAVLTDEAGKVLATATSTILLLDR